MRDGEHLESDGPPPTPSDADPLEEMEQQIEDMHRPYGSNEHTTAAEQRRGDSLDDRIGREEPERDSSRPEDVGTTLAEDDVPDAEPDLVGDAAEAGDRMAPEESAMRVLGDAPGATDHDDDYVEE